MKNVFYNNLKMCFCGQCHHENTQIVQISDDEELQMVTTKWLGGAYEKDICLQANDQKYLFQLFTDQFVWMEAGGGIVQDDQQSYLFIKRFGMWDLPKGKVEAGETIVQAALREVTEETGVDQLVVKSQLPDTFHLYPTKSKMILKCTHWFHMTTQSNAQLVPQLNEQITEAHWLSKLSAQQAILTTYRSLFDTLGYFFR